MAHRDLKPENILVVSNQPGKIHIKVCDFGISKRLSARGTSVYRTYCGTRAYKAPEIIGMIQEEEEESGTNNTNSIPRFLYNATVYRLYSKFRGRHSTGAYTEKVDLWSLGCIIYKMDQKTDLNRTGATPTEARTNKELRKKLEKMSIERSGIEFESKDGRLLDLVSLEMGNVVFDVFTPVRT
ncbi:putative serine threonine-protein kinase protein [Eutypa lata UCREL1]|uniref:non-specific serine/threonine protein kinase n=1 Tax=Eutypa lata (strain UCR-EL1) TaxID=1287681 RepID=M7TR94_EUTLA|nr:putative serine threonine-protein kinase protein [Eutypa lata UCREL1]